MNRAIQIFLLMIALLACSPHDVSVHSGSYFYETDITQVALALGKYRLRLGAGGGFDNTLVSYNGAIKGEDFVSWVRTTSEDYSVNRYFYVRSWPDQGFPAPFIFPYSADYHIKLIYGGMWWYEEGLTEEQKKDAVYLETVPSGRKVFYWGDGKSMYFNVSDKEVRFPEKTPLSWQKLPMLEITKAQYEILDKRCGWPWRNVRCFIDRDFPGLTPEQLEYVIAHEHEDDQDRLNGTVPMPEQPRSNPYK